MTMIMKLQIKLLLNFVGPRGHISHLGISQSTYLDKILKKFNMDQSKKGFLPVLQGTRLSTAQCPTMVEDREKMGVIPYASATGSIMYDMLCTNPDVSLAVSLVGKYQSNPGKEHWTAVKNILKYLKRTKEMFLVYGGDEELVVKGYSTLASTQIWMTLSHKPDTCIF